MVSEASSPLTATHHALLFAYLSRAVMQRVEVQRGEQIIRKAVRRYGVQRGRRMALRARANGDPQDMVNYFVYGEWEAADGEMAQEYKTASPDAEMLVHKCIWCDAWKAADLLEFGRYYCLEIDEALLQGYNPVLRMTVQGTQSNGAPYCAFTFHADPDDLNPENRERAAHKKAAVTNSAVMLWAYHCGHLYKTVREIFIAEIGDHGKYAAEQALKDFAERFGKQAARVVISYRDVDFDSLPE
ncbi:MAG: L-2-amino-thiazoline-4-carboxylic acid hydrolase [Anaerolineales bacterium]|nr:L-2-amino-thiazoline-4-carboxylic acid hydrolase [Anaerolineales bacterium]